MARPKKNDPEVLKRNVSAIRRSRAWRQQEQYDSLWKRMVNLYKGKHYDTKSTEDRMLVNMAFATKNVIAPSVAINNPKFTVNARRAEVAPHATVAEQVLNYLWRIGKYQDDFRLSVDDFLVIGHGWLKVAYKATKPKKIVKLDDHDADAEDPEGVDDRDEEVVGNAESEVNYFGEDQDRPFVERISPFDVLVDPDARHPKEMKWIAQRTKRPIADVLVDERYDKKIRMKVTASNSVMHDDDEKVDGRPERAGDVAYVDVWEFYDIRKGTVSTFAEGVTDGFLIAPAEMPYAFGHPFVMMRNYEVTDTFYPMGELESIEVLQKELNATRTQMMNHRKKYQRKTLYDSDIFDAKGIEALQDDRDNVLVPVALNGQGSLNDVTAILQQQGTPPEFYNQSDIISGDIDRVSGVSDYMRGAQAEIRRTATEAAMIQDAQNARAADKLSRVEQTLGHIGGRVVQLMQQFMTGEMVVRIAGPNAAPLWVTIDSDYIQGEFDYEVVGGSTAPNNETARRNDALQLVDAMAPFVGQGIVDPGKLARHVLQFGFDIKDPDSFMGQPMPMPGQEAPTEGQPGGPPQGPPGMPGPEQMALPMEAGMEGPPPAAGGIEGIPPELIAQLMGQQGLPLG